MQLNLFLLFTSLIIKRKLMKNENPFGKPENEGRDAKEMQKEWEIIW